LNLFITGKLKRLTAQTRRRHSEVQGCTRIPHINKTAKTVPDTKSVIPQHGVRSKLVIGVMFGNRRAKSAAGGGAGTGIQGIKRRDNFGSTIGKGGNKKLPDGVRL
jgi:hypothetical protein